jgi:hypothetical protein
VSFHEASGSVTGVCPAPDAGKSLFAACANADAGSSIDKVGSAAKVDSIARRLTSKNLSLGSIAGSFFMKKFVRVCNPSWPSVRACRRLPDRYFGQRL